MLILSIPFAFLFLFVAFAAARTEVVDEGNHRREDGKVDNLEDLARTVLELKQVQQQQALQIAEMEQTHRRQVMDLEKRILQLEDTSLPDLRFTVSNSDDGSNNVDRHLQKRPLVVTRDEFESFKQSVQRLFAKKRTLNRFRVPAEKSLASLEDRVDELEKCVPSCSQVYAVDAGSDDLVVIDISNGEVIEEVGKLHPDSNRFSTPVAMAKDMSGRLLVWNNSPDQDQGLSELNKSTGAATLIGQPQSNFFGALAFHGGQLYATGDVTNGLFAINIATGEPSRKCDLPVDVAGMDTNPNDQMLYGLAITGDKLVSFDPRVAGSSCAAKVIDMSQDVGVGGSIVWNRQTNKFLGSGFVPGGTFLREKTLFDLDPIDGTVSNIISLSTSGSPQGMAFLE